MFNKAFWTKTLEATLATFASTFAASGVFTGGVPTEHTWIASGVAAGIAALYTFVKAFAGNQAVTEYAGTVKK
jgi:hypothetical protein